jgi:Zn-finger nucleic acid-binding protein
VRGLPRPVPRLEKLIDAESAWSGATTQTAPPAPTYQPPPQQYGHPQQYSYGGRPYYKKKKSFLSELFDD